MLFNVFLPLFQSRSTLGLKEDIEQFGEGAGEFHRAPTDDWSLSKMFDAWVRISGKIDRSSQDVKFCLVACVIAYICSWGFLLFGLVLFKLSDQDFVVFAIVGALPVLFGIYYDFITVVRLKQDVRSFLINAGVKQFIGGFEHGYRLQRHKMGFEHYAEWFGEYESGGGAFKAYTWVKDLTMGATVLAAAGGWRDGTQIARVLQLADQVGSSFSANVFSITNAARQRCVVNTPRCGLGFFTQRRTFGYMCDKYVLGNLGALVSAGFGSLVVGVLAYRYGANGSKPIVIDMQKPVKVSSPSSHGLKGDTEKFTKVGSSSSHGLKEAKGKSKNRNLLKSGTTKVGRRFWAYEDDEGAEVFVFENDEGDIIAGPMKGSSQWLFDRFDDEYEMSGPNYGDSESSGVAFKLVNCPKVYRSLFNGLGYPIKKPDVPAKSTVSPKKKSLGNQESSLGGCGVSTSKCSIIKCRLKTDHNVWENVPIVGGKALVQKHIAGRNKPFVASNFEFVHGDKIFPLLGEGMKSLESKVQSEFLYFPAPQGIKSTNVPYTPSERGAIVKGVLVGYHALRDGDFTVCGGDVMSKGDGLVGRHTCSTEPGYCGSLVFDLSGSHPVLVGFHGFADNGTETNGYYKINAELAEEIRSLHFSKN